MLLSIVRPLKQICTIACKAKNSCFKAQGVVHFNRDHVDDPTSKYERVAPSRCLFENPPFEVVQIEPWRVTHQWWESLQHRDAMVGYLLMAQSSHLIT